ncbi:MAG: hypothetical protein HC933_11500 [Pleurocapsa sp. SU_196_0]|nr:hypothetical protein [Pleurocapsa sp. SU_196_0]
MDSTEPPHAAEAQLCLFGTPRWVDARGSTGLSHGSALWLLTYLAIQDAWVERSEIATLLWPEANSQDARNSLRQLLHRSKNAPWFAFLEATPQMLRFTADSDVRRFQRALSRADWPEAIHACSGPLLEGFQPGGPLEGWLESEREALQGDWREALLGRIKTLEAQRDTAELPALLQRLLEADPYNEDAVHTLLKVMEPSGQRDVALRQFEAFRQRLASDLGVEPHPDTVNLAARLAGTADVHPGTNLGLIGREAELRELLERCQDPELRLLTIRGPGGVGKTALARHALDAVRSLFPDGATWVSLREISKLEDAPSAIAAALGVTLRTEPSLWTQLANALGPRRALLVLDNLEHLGGIAEPLEVLLDTASQVKLLVTSRASLGTPREWVLPIDGLGYPSTPDLEQAHASSAVRLFVERAGRRRGGFALNRDALNGIVRVCAAVDGLPLGLELAAAWVTEFSSDALADALEANAELLETTDLAMPEAHRSLRTVFEHSWELLEDEWRRGLCALSVFRGGFNRRAALEGVGVSARTLLALVGRSLLTSAPGGRFDLHPAVQRLAWQKLELDERRRLQLAHAQYFVRQAEGAETHLCGGAHQIRLLESIAADHRNVLEVSDANADPVLVLRVVTALSRYWFFAVTCSRVGGASKPPSPTSARVPRR